MNSLNKKPMLKIEKGFKFETTGRRLSEEPDSMAGDGITTLAAGHNSNVYLLGEDGAEDPELELTAEEKTEIACEMINRWMRFGNVSDENLDRYKNRYYKVGRPII